MSNKILLLYLTTSQKTELAKCEKVFRSVFRKFRKSAVFTYLQIDTSPSCMELFCNKLSEELKKNDAVFLCGDIPIHRKRILLTDILKEYTEAHFLKGSVICCPPSSLTIQKEKNDIICTHTSDYENYKSTARIALEFAQSRKRSLTLCTDDKDGTGSFLKEALTELFDSKTHIDAEHLSLEEALMICINTIPVFDTVLATKQTADILKMHIGFNGRQRIPDGYSVIYTQHGKVYERQTFPYEQMSNLPIFTTLLAFSAMLENEFYMKNAANWLKRAICVSFETYKTAESDDFINRVISEIEKPMRTHTR